MTSCNVSFFIEPASLHYEELDEQVIRELGLMRRWWFTSKATIRFSEWSMKTNKTISGFIYEEYPDKLRCHTRKTP